MRSSLLITALYALGISLWLYAPLLRACPEDEQSTALPVKLARTDQLWELQLPHAVVHDPTELATRAELKSMPASVLHALARSSATIALMDEIGRKQGVVVVGLAERPELIIVPSGRSPYAALAALKRTRPRAWPASWSDLPRMAASLEAPARTQYLQALELVLPGTLERRPNHRYGKLVATECQNGPLEKFLLLAQADGRVALLSHAGFLGLDAHAPGEVAAHAPHASSSELWQLERKDPYTVSLRSARGTYLHWGSRQHFELDASATHVATEPVFQNNGERFFLWVNGDGTVTLKLPNNRVSVSVAEWELDRQGLDVNCHYYGVRQDPSPRKLPVAISLGTRS